MKLTTVMDNLPSEQKSLIAEHGLSFFVETDKIKILFDFGGGVATYENTRKLNISLQQIDYAIGSHGHYDHGAGYPELVQHGMGCPLLTGAGYFEEKYTYNGVKGTYLGTGFDELWLNNQMIEHRVCERILEFAPDCYLVGNFQRIHSFETISPRFCLRKNGDWIPDMFEDEVCLVLDQGDAVIVILGCSHPGVLNILTTVQSCFKKPIQAVFGGTHLVEADQKRIEKTIVAMKQMGIRLIGFNHCSGSRIKEALEEERELNVCYLGVGNCIYL